MKLKAPRLKKPLSNEQILYLLFASNPPLLKPLSKSAKIPNGDSSTALGNSRLPAGYWFTGNLRNVPRQPGPTIYIYFAASTIDKKTGLETTPKGGILQWPDARGTRQSLSLQSILGVLRYATEDQY